MFSIYTMLNTYIFLTPLPLILLRYCTLFISREEQRWPRPSKIYLTVTTIYCRRNTIIELLQYNWIDSNTRSIQENASTTYPAARTWIYLAACWSSCTLQYLSDLCSTLPHLSQRPCHLLRNSSWTKMVRAS